MILRLFLANRAYQLKKYSIFVFLPQIYISRAMAACALKNLHYFAWTTLNWGSINQHIYKFQRSIYYRAKRGQTIYLYSLQKQLLNTIAINLFISKLLLKSRRQTVVERSRDFWKLFGIQKIAISWDFLRTYRNPLVRIVNLFSIFMQKNCFYWKLILLAVLPELEAKLEASGYQSKGRNPAAAIYELTLASAFTCKLTLFPTLNFKANPFNRFSSDCFQSDMWPLGKSFFKGESCGLKSFSKKSGLGAVIKLWLCQLERYLQKCSYFTFKKKFANQKLFILWTSNALLIGHQSLQVIKYCRWEMLLWSHKFGLAVGSQELIVRHVCRAHRQNGPGFDFLGFFARKYTLQSLSRSIPAVILQPTYSSVQRLLLRVKTFLRRTTCTRVAIEHVYSAVASWFSYYQNFGIDKKIRKYLSFQIRSKFFYWIYRKYGKKGKKNLYCHYAQHIVNELDIRYLTKVRYS